MTPALASLKRYVQLSLSVFIHSAYILRRFLWRTIYFLKMVTVIYKVLQYILSHHIVNHFSWHHFTGVCIIYAAFWLELECKKFSAILSGEDSSEEYIYKMNICKSRIWKVNFLLTSNSILNSTSFIFLSPHFNFVFYLFLSFPR